MDGQQAEVSWSAWFWFWAFAFVLVCFIALAGCAHQESTLHRMNREVQECILSGGHAHLGPDNTIECAN